jgi:hypothetical protein
MYQNIMASGLQQVLFGAVVIDAEVSSGVDRKDLDSCLVSRTTLVDIIISNGKRN